MEKNKKIQKRTVGKKKKFTFIIIFVVLLLLAGAGLNYYRKHLEEKQRIAELEEQRRLEEQERERERRLLQEKRREFEALLREMKRYYEEGNFKEARKTAAKALALAEEYGFNTDEIYRILRLMDIAESRALLEKLQEQIQRDMYKYIYVRDEVAKIPAFPELRDLRSGVLRMTYESEYLVMLELAEKKVMAGKKGELVSHYYFTSRDILESARIFRNRHGISALLDREAAIRQLQKDLFFSSEELMGKTIPQGLYLDIK